jgi:transposase
VAEEVPWARPGARFTRAFEDTCAWLARDAPKSVVAQLLRVDWASVGRIIERVVAEAIGQRDGLDGLRTIGIDEVSYRKGHRYLTVVVDHERGAIVWCAQGRSGATLEKFFRDLGPERSSLIEAVSCDMSHSWPTVIQTHAPTARICIDPFHVIKLSAEALDRLRRAEWQRLRKDDPDKAEWLKGTRWALRRRPENLSESALLRLETLKAENTDVYAGYLIHDQLRAIYELPHDLLHRAGMLDEWIVMAASSGLSPFEKLAATIDQNYDGILAAMELGISNGRIEAMNSTVRLISHRSRGFRSLDSLLAMIRLVCGSIPLRLPRTADLLGTRITNGYTR